MGANVIMALFPETQQAGEADETQPAPVRAIIILLNRGGGGCSGSITGRSGGLRRGSASRQDEGADGGGKNLRVHDFPSKACITSDAVNQWIGRTGRSQGGARQSDSDPQGTFCLCAL